MIALATFDHRDGGFNLGSVPVGILVESSLHESPVFAARGFVAGSSMLRGNDRSCTDGVSGKFVVGF